MDNVSHAGHRARMKKKCKEYGFDCLAEHEKLEFLLFAFIPRRNVNPIAHQLIDTFGSFDGVLDASIEDLESVKGMTENAALFFSILPDVFSFYRLSKARKKLPVKDVKSASVYLTSLIGHKTEETLIMLCLDERSCILKENSYTSNNRTKVLLDNSTLLTNAIQTKSKNVILAHNHPNGDLSPSDADIQFTNFFAQSLAVLGIRLLDHIIVSGDEYLSMYATDMLVRPVDMSLAPNKVAEDIINWKKQIRMKQK